MGFNIVIIPNNYGTSSIVFGWISSIIWSVSGFPQIFKQLRNKSARGFSLDFSWINLLGSFCYFVFSSSVFFSNTIHQQLLGRKIEPRTIVVASDVVFGFMNFFTSLVIIILCYVPGYLEKDPDQRLARPLKITLVTISESILFMFVIAYIGYFPRFQTYDVLYIVSIIKALASLVKLCPQIYYNYILKDPSGYSYVMALFDITGGIFLAAELITASIRTHSWKPITGNPSRTWITLQSICFNIIIFGQYYEYLVRRDGRDSRLKHPELRCARNSTDNLEESQSLIDQAVES